MAYISVGIDLNSGKFQKAMTAAKDAMKALSSECSVATTRAKLFGNQTDVLESQAEGLKAKLQLQAQTVELCGRELEKARGKADKAAETQEELKKKVAAATKAYEESVAATGEKSEASKALKDELEKLEAREKSAGNAVRTANDAVQAKTATLWKNKEALAQLELELEEVNRELKNHKWEAYAEGAEKAGDKIQRAGQKLTVLTGAVVGMGVAAVKTTADFDYQMSAVQAVADATAEEYEALRDKAIELGEDTAFSASESAQALEFMAQAGWTVEDMLGGIAGVMDAAAAGGTDLATTASIVATGLSAFGMKAEESAHFADVLAKAASASKTEIEGMGETFKYAGAVCGTLGISLEDASVAAGLMANAGVEASMSGTAMRGGLLRLTEATEEAQAYMDKYGISLETTEDGAVDLLATMKKLRKGLEGTTKTERTAALAAIFGTNAVSGWAAVASASQEDFQKMTDAVYNCTGAAEKMADVRLDNLNGRMEQLGGTVETISIRFGDIMMPTVEKVTEKLQTLSEWLANTDEETKKNIANGATVVAAAGPVLLVLGKLISFSGKVAGAVPKALETISKLSAGLSGLTAGAGGTAGSLGLVTKALGFLTSPVGIVVAAIVGLIAVFAHLWNTNEEFRASITDTWNKIQAAVGGFIAGIKQRVEESGLPEKFEAFKTTIAAIWDGLCKLFAPLFENGFAQVETVIRTALDLILNLFDFWVGVFTGDWDKAWQGLSGSVETLFNGVSDMFGNMKQAGVDLINTILEMLGLDWKLPDIKTPHITITGEFSLNPPSVPKVDIEWYKTGAIMGSSMIFGMNGTTALGGGEAGQEAILPLEPFYKRLAVMLDSRIEKLSQAGAATVVYVTCIIDGEEITTRQIIKVERHLTTSTRAMRKATV